MKVFPVEKHRMNNGNTKSIEEENEEDFSFESFIRMFIRSLSFPYGRLKPIFSTSVCESAF